MFEAAVAESRAPRGLRVHFIPIPEHCLNRAVQAVQVQPVKPCLDCAGRELTIVVAHPLDKLEHHGIAPHPCREPPEASQGCLHGLAAGLPPDVTIDPVSIRPVGFHRYRGEALLPNQTPRDLRALVVKFMRAVGSLSQQYELGIADDVQQRIVVRRCLNRKCRLANCVAQRHDHRTGHQPLA